MKSIKLKRTDKIIIGILIAATALKAGKIDYFLAGTETAGHGVHLRASTRCAPRLIAQKDRPRQQSLKGTIFYLSLSQANRKALGLLYHL